MDYKARWRFLLETQFRDKRGLATKWILAIIFGLGLYDLLVDQFASNPDDWPQVVDIIPWSVWLVIVALIGMIATFEGGYRAAKVRDQTIDARDQTIKDKDDEITDLLKLLDTEKLEISVLSCRFQIIRAENRGMKSWIGSKLRRLERTVLGQILEVDVSFKPQKAEFQLKEVKLVFDGDNQTPIEMPTNLIERSQRETFKYRVSGRLEAFYQEVKDKLDNEGFLREIAADEIRPQAKLHIKGGLIDEETEPFFIPSRSPIVN